MNTDLQKFGIKLFFQPNGSYPYRDFIPELHRWIQNESISEHMLIDVVDYSHILDGPGIMLVAHEGHFSLDQENNKPGILYMRKTDISGSFQDRFNKVLSITIQAAQLLSNNNINKELNFSHNSFRFISNDRRIAPNTLENQELYRDVVNEALENNYSDEAWSIEDFSSEDERLAFTVNFNNEIIILNQSKENLEE